MYNMHHPKDDIDRPYVKRKEAGRGLSQIEAAHKTEIINTAEYLNKKYLEPRALNYCQLQSSNFHIAICLSFTTKNASNNMWYYMDRLGGRGRGRGT
jgi:hypothetical protein